MFKKRLRLIFILNFSFSFIILSCVDSKTKIETDKLTQENDSIYLWITNAKSPSYGLNEKKRFLAKAYQVSTAHGIDTTRVRHLSTIAYLNLKLNDTQNFRKKNKEALKYAEELKDHFGIADAHWNYASYYNNTQVYDSAYYHFNLASSNFDQGGYLYESAKTLYGMAFIKGRFRDYTGSEILTFKAIKKFKKAKHHRDLYSCYNHLAILQVDIHEYDKGLFYHNKALSFIEKIKNKEALYEGSYNNIGNVYLKKKNYAQALHYYKKIIKNDSLKISNTGRYARVLDNTAYCNFLMGNTQWIYKQFNEALAIREKIKDKEGVIRSKLHLSEYHAYRSDTTKAIRFAKEAQVLANEIKNSREYLESLILLSQLDKKHATEYLKEYIRFSDSIQIVERKIQNKFTRISYETDEYIEENKRLSQQKLWISSFGVVLIFIICLFYYIYLQKTEKEKLLLEKEEQKANEQVYLTTVKLQEKLEKTKVKERNRIAEELHDDTLGKLFGVRVSLGFLEIDRDEKVKKKYKIFINELQNIEQDIRNISHKLSENFDSKKVSFIKIIRQLVEDKGSLGNFKYELNSDKKINWQKINQKVKINLYRITQEALQNIIKYASAKNVTVEFSLADLDYLIVNIKDDGIGFQKNKKGSGIGMKNITTRVKRLKGSVTINSKINQGTSLKIQIPIQLTDGKQKT